MRINWPFVIIGSLGLFLVYFFQEYLDFYSVFFKFQAPERLNYQVSYVDADPLSFIVNKVGRYLLNDLFSIAIIYGLFSNKRYAQFAFLIMLFGLLILLPIYSYLYLNQIDGFSSMISHLHRLVMNPIIMMLLIPAFYFQQKNNSSTQH